MLHVDVPWNLPHKGHWWQPQHSPWAWHDERTRQAGSVECRAVFVWAAESLALLCWKTLLLTTASFVNLADFIFVAWELCNGYVGTIPKVWAELMLCCLLCSWDWNPWEAGVCKGYWWLCYIKHSRNKHLLSGSSFGQYSLREIRKSLRPVSVRGRLGPCFYWWKESSRGETRGLNTPRQRESSKWGFWLSCK